MATRLLGGQRELHAKHLWVLLIDGFADVNFQKCSELSFEHADITYNEGGSSIPWKMPGKQTFPDVTLERGSSSDTAFYDWAILTSNAAAHGTGLGRGKGAVAGAWCRQGQIQQLDRDGVSVLKRWRLVNAYCKKIVVADGWDATADEVVMESLVLAIDWWERA